MLHIGCHLSSDKGLCAMGRQALALGADTFQFFTRNPRGSRAKALDAADIPHVKLGVDQQMRDFGQASTAIQAFADVL